MVRTLRPDAVASPSSNRTDPGTRRGSCTAAASTRRPAAAARRLPDRRRVQRRPGGTNTYTVDDPYRWLPTLGELDQHLIREGRHERLWEVLGSHVRRYDTPRGTVEGVSFAVWAPNARGVKVAGDFDYWGARAYPMRSLGSSGIWEIFVPGVQVGSRYRYHVLGADGTWREKSDRWLSRPRCRPERLGRHRATYEWADDDVARRAGRRRLAREADERLRGAPRLVAAGAVLPAAGRRTGRLRRAAGFTHIEFMPVAEHPFGGSWGYQVTSYYAPTLATAHPDDFRYLVDRAAPGGHRHHRRLGAGALPEGRLGAGPVRRHAPVRALRPAAGRAAGLGHLVFDFGRSEVRNFLVANALYWCKEFHVDGLRVDAVASMLYLDYSRKRRVGAQRPRRPGEPGGRGVFAGDERHRLPGVPGVMTIAEESTAWPGVTRPTHLGGLGFGFKWNMGWMHDTLGYMQQAPVYRSYHHRQLTFSMMYAYSENYILPISHDEVVYGKGSLLRRCLATAGSSWPT